MATPRCRLRLPEGWQTFDQDDLADPDVRRQLEADFAGADTLFAQLDAQGNRAPLVFLAVDPRERGTGRFPGVVTAVAVEPALPPMLLGVGADFATDAFESTFELESDVTKSDVDTPLGDGIRLQFTHRLVGPGGGPGFAAEHDGAIVTTGEETFLVSTECRSGDGRGRHTDPGGDPGDAPGRFLSHCYPLPRRGGRAVEGGALEKRRVARLRGFESHPLRQQPVPRRRQIGESSPRERWAGGSRRSVRLMRICRGFGPAGVRDERRERPIPRTNAQLTSICRNAAGSPDPSRLDDPCDPAHTPRHITNSGL